MEGEVADVGREMNVVPIYGAGHDDALAMLREALKRCEANGWTTVVVLGYTGGKVEIVASAHRSTDALVGALERAKWELFDRT